MGKVKLPKLTLKGPIKIHPAIDKILSYEGGFIRGHLYEIAAADGAGKTTFATICMAKTQQAGGKVGYIEVEYLDRQHAKFLGLDIEEADIRQPAHAEEAVEMLLEMCALNYDMVVLDSVGGLVTKSQKEEEEVGKKGQFGQIASLFGNVLAKVKDAARDGGTVVILLNQMRAKISTGFGFSPKEQTYGGFTLKHTVSARFDIHRVSWIKYGVDVIGFKMKIRAPHKNRFACPMREGFLDIIFDEDVNLEEATKRKTKDLNLIQKETEDINDS